MDDLWAEFERVKATPKKLEAFHDKIASLRILDPACGCGNFLIITYKELRRLELEIIKMKYPSRQRLLDVSSLIKVRIDGGRLTVSSNDSEFARSAEESLLCDYAGAPMTIGFKGPFLLELLNNLSGEEVVIRLADGTRAGVIVPAEQKENEEVLMLLMPLMIND